MTGAAWAAAPAAGKASLFDWAVLSLGVVAIVLLVRELRAARAAGGDAAVDGEEG